MSLTRSNRPRSPSWSARGAGFAFTRQAEPLACRDTGRNLHRELPFRLHAAGAAARRARRADDLAGAATLTARARDGEEALLISELTAAVALRTGRRARSGSCTRAVARLARFLPGNLDGGFRSARGFLERDFEVVTQVRAPLRAAPA